MLVSHRKQFIFVKTSKTAGTSVESYFEQFCLPEGEWQQCHFRDEVDDKNGMIGYRGLAPQGCRLFNHMSAAEIKAAISLQKWQEYFKFSIIRNPFDRVVSWYFFQRKYIQKINLNSWPRKQVIDDFRYFANSSHFLLTPQISVNGSVDMDFLILYEDLEKGLAHVCHHLNIPFVPNNLPTFKSGIRDNNFSIADLYDNETKMTVYQNYDADFVLGDYAFPNI
jgi:hypothetical protein